MPGGRAGGSTDYKAFPSLALSFELGLGMAIIVFCLCVKCDKIVSVYSQCNNLDNDAGIIQ